MKKIAVFPGSFDPFTKGHESVINKAFQLFDEVIIAIGVNNNKKYQFSLETRIKHVRSIYANNPQVSVQEFTGLTVDFCKTNNAQFILRGLRDTKDFEYEKSISQMNLDISGVETVFFITDANVSAVSSTIIRELYVNGMNIEQFVSNANLLK